MNEHASPACFSFPAEGGYNTASMDFTPILAARRDEPQIPHHRPVGVWLLIFIVLILVAVAVYVIGPTPGGPGTSLGSPTVSPAGNRESRVYTVSYRGGVFSPTNLRIHAGDSVRFRNDGLLPIRIIADKNPRTGLPEFDSIGALPAGGYFSYTFADVGTFGYHTGDDVQEAGVIIVR